jgi:hypothetical protein
LFWWDWGFVLAKQVLYCLNHDFRPFCSGYFGDGILRTVCLGWPQTAILLISNSQIARITGVSLWHLDLTQSFKTKETDAKLKQGCQALSIFYLPCKPK